LVTPHHRKANDNLTCTYAYAKKD